MLRRGTTQLVFDVDLTAADDRYRYHVELASRSGAFHVESEALVLDDQQVLFSRQGDTLRYEGGDRPAPKGTVLSNLALLNPLVSDVHAVLSGIEVHVPFATQARWFGPGLVPERNLRMDNIVQSTDRVDRGGANLANAFHALRNRPDWADTLDTIKLVIDDDITDVTTPASASGGIIGLSVSYRTTGAVPAFARRLDQSYYELRDSDLIKGKAAQIRLLAPANMQARLQVCFLDRNLETLLSLVGRGAHDLGDALGKSPLHRDKLLQRAAADEDLVSRACAEMPSWNHLVTTVVELLS